jgi:hypothetical protein
MLSTQTIYDNSKLYNSLISYRKKKIPSFLGTPLYIVIIKLIYIDVAWTINNMWGIGVVIRDTNRNCVAAAAWCVETS